MDPCHVLVFLGRIDSHLHDLAHTEVIFNKHVSFLHKILSIKICRLTSRLLWSIQT